MLPASGVSIADSTRGNPPVIIISVLICLSVCTWTSVSHQPPKHLYIYACCTTVLHVCNFFIQTTTTIKCPWLTVALAAGTASQAASFDVRKRTMPSAVRPARLLQCAVAATAVLLSASSGVEAANILKESEGDFEGLEGYRYGQEVPITCLDRDL